MSRRRAKKRVNKVSAPQASSLLKTATIIRDPAPLAIGGNGQNRPAAMVSRCASPEALRECLNQASQTARAYMELRFKHFGTFVVLTGLLGTATFQFQTLAGIRPALCAIPVILTVLFWLLDFRTSQYFDDEIQRIRCFKKQLHVPSIDLPKRVVLLRASHATNLIFLMVLVMWTLIWHHYNFGPISILSTSTISAKEHATPTSRPY